MIESRNRMDILYVIGGVLLGGGIIFGLLWWRFNRPQVKNAVLVNVHDRWRQIEHLLKKPQGLNCKLAVIEADQLVDEMFQFLSVPGADADQRWKNAAYRYPPLRHYVWMHKLRNQVERDRQYPLRYTVARPVINKYKKVLHVLHVF